MDKSRREVPASEIRNEIRNGKLEARNSKMVTRAARMKLFALIAALSAGSLWARDFPPAVESPKPFVLPAPAIKTLANGLRVVVIEQHRLPVVSLRMTIETGAEADPKGLAGAAEYVAGLLDEGTVRRSSRQIADAIDQIGGTIDTGADWDNSFAAISVLHDNIPLGFDVLSDIIIRPNFPPAEVERGRKQLLSSLDVLGGDPAYLADTAFSQLVFSGTPYSHPAEGTAAAVRRISREDLKNFHSRYYVPSNAILAAVGDITPDDAFRLGRKYFGEWRGSLDPAPKGAVTEPAEALRQILVIDKPDAVQTEIRIGELGVPRSSPDYEALNIANEVLGGPAVNWLFRALRAQHGLTYGASSDLNCYRGTGSWVSKTSTRTSETLESVKLMLDEIRKISDHKISRDELEQSRDYLVGHMALQFETPTAIAAHVLDLMIHGLPLDYSNREPAIIGDLSTADIWNATRRYLDPSHLAIVLVGNAVEFKKDLNKLGPVQIVPVSVVDFTSPGLDGPSAATAMH